MNQKIYKYDINNIDKEIKMVKYNIKGRLYKIANLGLYAGGGITGFGVATLHKRGKFGLEEVIGGVLIAGISIYYRRKCRTENSLEENRNLEKIE